MIGELEHLAAQIGVLAGDHTPYVLLTIQRSIDALAAEGRSLLAAAACFASLPIPLSVLIGARVEAGTDPTIARRGVEAGAHALVSASLARRTDRGAIVVHRLVLDVARHLAAGATNAALEQQLHAVLGRELSAIRDASQHAALADHYTLARSLPISATSPVSVWVGWYQRQTGDVVGDLTTWAAILADGERVLVPDHPNTLQSRNNLAATFQAVGRNNDAITLLERTVTDSERVLGPDHPNTLTSRNNLAETYRAVGRYDDAITLHERTLTDSERVLGPDHPDTLTSRNNLAETYSAVGRYDDAITLLERTVTDFERVLGPDHPDTLTSRNNLAVTYRAVGRNDDAAALERGRRG